MVTLGTCLLVSLFTFIVESVWTVEASEKRLGKRSGKDWRTESVAEAAMAGKDEEQVRFHWVVILIELLLLLLEKRQLFELPGERLVQMVESHFHLLRIALQSADLKRRRRRKKKANENIVLFFRKWFNVLCCENNEVF